MSKTREGKYYTPEGYEIGVIKDAYGFFVATTYHPGGEKEMGPMFYLEEENDSFMGGWVHESEYKALKEFDQDLKDLLEDEDV